MHLAERAHMEVPSARARTPPKKDRDRLYAALTAAAKFYYKTLYSPAEGRALQYLHGRGIRDNVIRRFGLGATAAGHASLTQHLKEQGFSEKELIESNLALERGGRVFDTFRDRVMFPIFDPRGRVIAFGGRVIGQGGAKYLNSGDTPVFNKRRNVYGLNFLRAAGATGCAWWRGIHGRGLPLSARGGRVRGDARHGADPGADPPDGATRPRSCSPTTATGPASAPSPAA